MRKLMAVAVLCGLVGLMVGCYRAPVMPPIGAIYSGIEAPLSTEFSGQSTGLKSGEASSSSILGLIATGDCSIEAAAEDGGLSTVEYCDYKYTNVFGIYQSFTVVAYGR